MAWGKTQSAVGASPGIDIVGEIYDAEDGVVRDNFQINRFGTTEDERDYAIAAACVGGRTLTDLFDPIGSSNRSDIVWARFDAHGARIGQASVAQENEADASLSKPQVAVNLADDSVAVTCPRTVAGDDDIRGVVFGTGPQTLAFDAAQNSSDRDADGDAAILTNGDYVSVCAETDVCVVGVEARLFTVDGAVLTSRRIESTTSTDPEVAALVGGGFVTVWNTPDGNQNVQARISNQNGMPGGLINVATTADSANESIVVALPHRGFFVAWDNDRDDTLEGRAFQADGSPDGAVVVIADPARDPDVGAGNDTLSVDRPFASCTMTREVGGFRFVAGDETTFAKNVERFVFTDRILTAADLLRLPTVGSDTLSGAARGDEIYALAGNDQVSELGGADLLIGGSGRVRLLGGGGGGRDICSMAARSGRGGRIEDLQGYKDRIEIQSGAERFGGGETGIVGVINHC